MLRHGESFAKGTGATANNGPSGWGRTNRSACDAGRSGSLVSLLRDGPAPPPSASPAARNPENESGPGDRVRTASTSWTRELRAQTRRDYVPRAALNGLPACQRLLAECRARCPWSHGRDWHAPRTGLDVPRPMPSPGSEVRRSSEGVRSSTNRRTAGRYRKTPPARSTSPPLRSRCRRSCDSRRVEHQDALDIILDDRARDDASTIREDAQGCRRAGDADFRSPGSEPTAPRRASTGDAHRRGLGGPQ